MRKPRLLDAFCGAGGCTKGYQDAGFYVVGVDINPQPRYIGDEFHQVDALEFIAEHGHEFDVIHASPPCQFGSEATPVKNRSNHKNYIPSLRKILQKVGQPYVIENVEGVRKWLQNPLLLCGSMLDLPIWRHRYFEIFPYWFMSPASCRHDRQPITVNSGSHTRKTWIPVLCTGGGDGQLVARRTHRPRESIEVVRWAMEIDWMTSFELTQAIPPKYCEWIGKQLLQVIGCTNANPVL